MEHIIYFLDLNLTLFGVQDELPMRYVRLVSNWPVVACLLAFTMFSSVVTVMCVGSHCVDGWN